MNQTIPKITGYIVTSEEKLLLFERPDDMRNYLMTIPSKDWKRSQWVEGAEIYQPPGESSKS